MGNSYLTVCSVISNKWAYISEVWGSLNPHYSHLNPFVLKSAFDRRKKMHSALGKEVSSSDIRFAGAEFEEQLITEDSELKESEWDMCKTDPFECKCSLIFIWGRGSNFCLLTLAMRSTIQHAPPSQVIHLLCLSTSPPHLIFHLCHSPVTDAHIPTWVLNPTSPSVRRIRMEEDFFDLRGSFMGRLEGEDGRRWGFPVYQRGVDGHQIAGNIIEDNPVKKELLCSPALSC